MHEYEDDRLVRSVTTREPEWDEEQQALMLAHLMHERLTCSGCGGHLPDTTDPKADGAYIADEPIRCHRCTAIAMRAEQYRESPQPQALMFPTRRRGES